MRTYTNKAESPEPAGKTTTFQLADDRRQAKDIAALQAMADGSRQVRQTKSMGKAILQRHKKLGADEYTLGAESDSEHFFTTQSPELFLNRKSNKYNMSHRIDRTDEQQDLLVSDDGSMAINSTAAHAKEFYAEDAVLNAAKEKLAQVKSRVTLNKSGELSLTAQDKTLSKIVPAPADAEEGAGDAEFASLVSDICIEMATGVMGSSDTYKHEAVLKPAGDAPETVVNIKSGERAGDDSIGRLASALVDSPAEVDPKAIRSGMLSGEDVDVPGKQYGTQAGEGQLADKARQLGINQYASPDVGEAYATFSLKGDNGKQVDYLQTGKRREILNSVWGYHFATVVARSLDGKDSVTLENYNRSGDIVLQLQNIIARLVGGNEAKFRDIAAQIKPEKNEPIQTAQQKLVKTLAVARNVSAEKAQAEYDGIMKSYNTAQAWFFSMQGSGKGQSFHEQQSNSDAVVNPMTLRVRPQDEAREDLRASLRRPFVDFPRPAGLMQSQPAFGAFWDEKSAIITAMDKAEREDDIRAAVQTVNDGLADYAINQTIAAISACATRSGVKDFATKAGVVTQQKAGAAKFNAAIGLGGQAYSDIEDETQKLWVSDVEKRMAYAMNQAIVYSGIEYLRVALTFHRNLS
ncbi:hypothetical protein ACEN9F_02500 [Duganella sp. CT11-25]|uniref:hypothetical protein n=1 Tax=unclassified Duganella TaxID=2636909 RepID=UPI0039AF6E5A